MFKILAVSYMKFTFYNFSNFMLGIVPSLLQVFFITQNMQKMGLDTRLEHAGVVMDMFTS